MPHLLLFTNDTCSLVNASESVVIAVGIEKNENVLRRKKNISSPDNAFIVSKGENSDFLS